MRRQVVRHSKAIKATMPINTTGTSVIMAKLISMISMGYLLYEEANIIPYVVLRKTQDAGTFSLYGTAIRRLLWRRGRCSYWPCGDVEGKQGRKVVPLW